MPYNKNAMLVGVLIIGVLAWATHTRDRGNAPKYQINGKYEELRHVEHANWQQQSPLTKIRAAAPSASRFENVLSLNQGEQ